MLTHKTTRGSFNNSLLVPLWASAVCEMCETTIHREDTRLSAVVTEIDEKGWLIRLSSDGKNWLCWCAFCKVSEYNRMRRETEEV